MVTVVYVKSIVFMYASIFVDIFYILWPAGQFGSMEFEIKLNEVCAELHIGWPIVICYSFSPNVREM
jgi:hypothetical protein